MIDLHVLIGSVILTMLLLPSKAATKCAVQSLVKLLRQEAAHLLPGPACTCQVRGLLMCNLLTVQNTFIC